MSEVPREPTSPPRVDAPGPGTHDAGPPPPPHELPRPEVPVREFVHEGRGWVARVAGKGAWGTGSYGLGLVEAIHFAAADAPEVPLREALISRGRFEALYDAELVELLERATAIPPEAGRS